MTKSEKYKIYYRHCKDNGLCPRCGKVLDRKGHYCTTCLEKSNQYSRETKAFYRSIGICPTCQKNKLFGDEKTCLECIAKACEYGAKARAKDIEAYNRRHNENSKKRRARYIAEGMCGKCGKNKPAVGYKTCAICLDKLRTWRASKGVGQKTEDRYDRVSQGYCWYCDKPAEVGYKTCAEHHNKSTEWARKAHEVRKGNENGQTRTNN